MTLADVKRRDEYHIGVERRYVRRRENKSRAAIRHDDSNSTPIVPVPEKSKDDPWVAIRHEAEIRRQASRCRQLSSFSKRELTVTKTN
jgi:hypothetical protein